MGTRNRCASYRQHPLPAPVGWIKRSGSANVGRLREASRQNPLPWQNPKAGRSLQPFPKKPVRFLSSAHPARTGGVLRQGG
nr:hypothetical protein [Methylomarinum sp. Ch1-1]MDP4519895.1 hypothetical protein [Methylomarinum sp. Ch1-1]